MSPIKLKGTGETISELLRRAGQIIVLPCGGRGVCGGCAVLASGELDLPSKKEQSLLDRKAIKPADSFTPRLACFCRVLGDAEVILRETAKMAVSHISCNIPDYDGNERFALGVAIDVGVTRLALELHNLNENMLLTSQTGLNPQAVFGEDVLSRITYALQNGFEELRDVLLSALWEMIETALLEVKVFAEDIRRVVLTGNTTMLHFIRGINPVADAGLFGESFPAAEVFPSLTRADLYVPRCISANIGADITCGLYAAECLNKPGASLYVDAGTNSEIVLIRDKKILCGAAASSPVFEGAKIIMGMAAEAGAVQHVRHTGYGIMCDTISDSPPAGICGSGIISAASLLMEMGELDETGYLETDPYELGNSGIHIHGRDIRELQLAKSAIAAGITALLKAACTTEDSADRLILAGGFGSSFDTCEAAAIGLIPNSLQNKTIYAGNAALLGAVICLYSQNARQKIFRIANDAEEIPLTETPEFNQLLTDRMAFKPY